MRQYLKIADIFDYEVTGKDIAGMARGGLNNSLDLAAHAINSHDELVQMNQELLAELKAMAKAYVNLLGAGKDRIESLGGDCDEVTYMAAHDVDLVHACSVIGKYEGGAA